MTMTQLRFGRYFATDKIRRKAAMSSLLAQTLVPLCVLQQIFFIIVIILICLKTFTRILLCCPVYFLCRELVLNI